MKRTKTTLTIVFLLLVAFSCKKDENEEPFSSCTLTSESRGNRILAFDILDLTESGNFGMNYNIASEELQGGFIQLLQPWNAFENDQEGVYDGEAMQLFEILNQFAGSQGTQLSLIITPIDIPGRFLPAYLSGKKFNDALVIQSFNNLIDRLFNADNGVINPDRVFALSVGNEIDHYNWAANNDQISEYKDFLEAIKAKVNAYGIPLHFTGTLYGMTQPGNTWLDLANVVDKVSVTYYPINGDFTVRPADIVKTDLSALASKFNGRDIFIQEIGYPSSSALNSNERKQAEFFCNFFNVWDSYKDQITHVSILRLNDVSLTSAQATADTYGVPSNQRFIEYIRTLGIRTWENEGTNKMAFDIIKSEINRRNW
ncbi:MAG: hypothetical protein ACFCUU_00300 [Cyclobacteriaceae bacterium]